MPLLSGGLAAGARDFFILCGWVGAVMLRRWLRIGRRNRMLRIRVMNIAGSTRSGHKPPSLWLIVTGAIMRGSKSRISRRNRMLRIRERVGMRKFASYETAGLEPQTTWSILTWGLLLMLRFSRKIRMVRIRRRIRMLNFAGFRTSAWIVRNWPVRALGYQAPAW